MKNVINFTPHRKKCAALRMVEEGHWPTPWFFDGESRYSRGWRFFLVRCNDAECSARFWIRSRAIEAEADQELKKELAWRSVLKKQVKW